MTLKFRNLRADEIECRVSYCGDNGVSLLLYKDARVDQNLLDQTVGPMNWEREHSVIDGSLYCTVSIWDPDRKIWVSKQDVGSESNTEKEKARASDAFKRACFNWGLGRELYTAPFIWVNPQKCNIITGRNGRLTCKDNFKVKEIRIENGKIVHLVVTNDTLKRQAFSWNLEKVRTNNENTQPIPQEPQAAEPIPEDMDPQKILVNNNHITAFKSLCEKTRVSVEGMEQKVGKPLNQWNMDEYLHWTEVIQNVAEKQKVQKSEQSHLNL